MRKLYMLSIVLSWGLLTMAQSVRVLSNNYLGDGFIPHISTDGSVVDYIVDPSTEFPEKHDPSLYVTNEDLHLYLYQDGVCRELLPHGANSYIWAQLSPDRSMILFHSHRGTAVCDLQGRVLYELGELINPCWFGNDYVVGAYTCSDGHEYTSSKLMLQPLGGQPVQLTDGTAIDMFPHASSASGRIVYNNLAGQIRMLQLNLSDLPVSSVAPRMQVVQPLQQPRRAKAQKKQPSDLKIYINPGHGGYTGNDRGVQVYPFAQGDTTGFWESTSNLHKGLMLDSMLRALGVQTKMSRRYNREEDDLDLHVIVAEANAYNADFMLSIHSNAGGPSNYILQLYSGKDADDPITYNDFGTRDADSRAISTVIGNNLQQSTPLSSWTRTPYIVGDKTFARKIMGWSNGYGVLRYLRVPGEISEGGMHDYIPQTYRLLNMDYKRMEAYAFARAFLSYFLDYHYATGVVGGQVRDSYEPMSFPSITRNTGTPDINKPILGATVQLLQDGNVIRTYTTDTLYNGVYFFWDLEPGEYVVRASSPDHYSKDMPVTVLADHVTYQDMMVDRKRNTPLSVVSYAPQVAQLTDSVKVSAEVTITFNWDMLVDSVMKAFSITPAVDGALSVSPDNRILYFRTERRFEPGTEYTVSLSTTACHPDTNFQNHLAAPFSFKFRTSNRINLGFVQSYPSSGDQSVPVGTSFIAMFDQKLASWADIRVEDANGKEQAKNTRAVTYNKAPSPYGYVAFDLVNALQPNTDYVLVIGPDMKDNLGIYFNQTMRIPFRTSAEPVIEPALVDPVDTLCITYRAEDSREVASGSTLRNTNKKFSGVASNELYYKFAAETKETSEAFYPFTNPTLINATSDDQVGMYVYGDYSSNVLYAVFSVEGDLRYAKVCDLDYVGWKYQSVDLSVLPTGVSYQLSALQIAYTGQLMSGSGRIYIDNLYYLQGEPSAVTNISSSAEVEKCIEDGNIVIIKNGVRYNALGQKLTSY